MLQKTFLGGALVSHSLRALNRRLV